MACHPQRLEPLLQQGECRWVRDIHGRGGSVQSRCSTPFTCAICGANQLGGGEGFVAINWARVHCSIVLPHFPQLLSNTLILIHNGWFNAAVFPAAGLWLTRTSQHCPAQHENTTFCSAPAHLCSLLTGWWLRWRGMPSRDSRWTSGASAAAWHWTLLAAPPSGEPHSCVAVCWCVLGWGGVDWGGEGHPWAGSL